MKLKHLLLIGLLFIITSFYTLWAAETKTIKVGVTPGSHTKIMEQVKKQAAMQGLIIQIVEFNDYVQPNSALAAGELDANSYQHEPYLKAYLSAHPREALINIAYTITEPMGVYAQRIKKITELKSGAVIAIPNDPTNGGRALLLLQANGLIQLKPGTGLLPTLLDISHNPKNLKFRELDAAQLPRILADVDLAAINTNFALEAGLIPTRDALLIEAAQGPYANIMVIRAQDKNQPWIKQFLAIYHSAAIKQFIHNEFKGAVIPAW